MDLTISCQGDTDIDDHHTVEDIGITLGQAFSEAVGDKKGLTRYGHSYVPLDEALSRVVIDLSGRPGLDLGVKFTRDRVGSFDLDLIREFFQGFVNHSLVTLHIDNLKGINSHHQAETVFKALEGHLEWQQHQMKDNQVSFPQQRVHSNSLGLTSCKQSQLWTMEWEMSVQFRKHLSMLHQMIIAY